jgi:hypothetical protein
MKYIKKGSEPKKSKKENHVIAVNAIKPVPPRRGIKTNLTGIKKMGLVNLSFNYNDLLGFVILAGLILELDPS